MTDVLKAIGSRIRVLRKTRKPKPLSQEKLAELAGVHHTYIGAIERGEKNVTLETLLRVAQALGVSIEDLLPLPNTSGQERIAEIGALLEKSDPEFVEIIADFLRRVDEWRGLRRRRSR
jgi:transcriptional regulator with XRE-family HTH domain